MEIDLLRRREAISAARIDEVAAARIVGKITNVPHEEICTFARLFLDHECGLCGELAELITNLGQISALRVISRTSVMTYKGIRKPLAQIAGELNVDAVVEGSVLRSGERVRITAQIDPGARRQAHLGAEL